MSKPTKQRNTLTISINDKSNTFLEKRREALNMSDSTYINELLLFAQRIRKQLKSNPRAELAIVNEYGEEISPVFVGQL